MSNTVALKVMPIHIPAGVDLHSLLKKNTIKKEKNYLYIVAYIMTCVFCNEITGGLYLYWSIC